MSTIVPSAPIATAIVRGLATVTPWGWVALGAVYLLTRAYVETHRPEIR